VLDEHGPAAPVEPGRFGNRGQGRCIAAGLSVGGSGGVLFGAEAAGLVGVAAVVANEMLVLVGDVLGQFGREVERLKELVVA